MSFASDSTAFNAFKNVLSNVISKTKNLGYNSQKNITGIAGITNCEDLRILGQPVALRNHTHPLNDVVYEYTEEETYEEEEDGEVVTGTRTVTNLLM